MNRSNLKFSRALKARRFAYQIRELGLQFLDRVLAFTGVRFCASKLNYVAALEKARMDADTTTVGNAGKLWIYKGTQPAGPGTTHALTLVAGPFTMASPFAPGATTALPSVLSPTLPSNVNATTADQPTWWRIGTSASTDGAVGIIDGSAGTSGCDMTISPTTAGQPVAITAASFSSATFGH